MLDNNIVSIIQMSLVVVGFMRIKCINGSFLYT